MPHERAGISLLRWHDLRYTVADLARATKCKPARAVTKIGSDPLARCGPLVDEHGTRLVGGAVATGRADQQGIAIQRDRVAVGVNGDLLRLIPLPLCILRVDKVPALTRTCVEFVLGETLHDQGIVVELGIGPVVVGATQAELQDFLFRPVSVVIATGGHDSHTVASTLQRRVVPQSGRGSHLVET